MSIIVFISYFNNPQAVVNITWTANFLFSTKFEFDSIFPRKASQYGHCIRRILTHTCSIKLNCGWVEESEYSPSTSPCGNGNLFSLFSTCRSVDKNHEICNQVILFQYILLCTSGYFTQSRLFFTFRLIMWYIIYMYLYLFFCRLYRKVFLLPALLLWMVIIKQRIDSQTFCLMITLEFCYHRSMENQTQITLTQAILTLVSLNTYCIQKKPLDFSKYCYSWCI